MIKAKPETIKEDEKQSDNLSEVENHYDNTFVREKDEQSQATPRGTPPSVVGAMKALQNKIKTLEKDKENMSKIIANLELELKSYKSSPTKSATSEQLEQYEKALFETQTLSAHKEEELRSIILDNKQTIQNLVAKLKTTSKQLNSERASSIQLQAQLTAKDQALSDLKIDLVETTQAMEGYREELDKVGDVEKVRKRLENEKKARRQLVREKVSGCRGYLGIGNVGGPVQVKDEGAGAGDCAVKG